MAKLDSRFINFLATDEEASSGLLEDKAVTPKQFKISNGSFPATNKTAGIIKVANYTEAFAGNNSTTAINPSKVFPIVWNITAKWKDAPISSLKNWRSVCWSPELRLFCAIAYNSNIAAISHDGITWTLKTVSSLKNWHNICWSPELRSFCAVAYNSNTSALYSLK